MGWVRISIDETCHWVWKVHADNREITLHAIGDGPVGNRVTPEMAQARFADGKCITPWLPVLFPHRAVTVGRRSHNCVTAAMRALLRGWVYFG